MKSNGGFCGIMDIPNLKIFSQNFKTVLMKDGTSPHADKKRYWGLF
jgi:hypothetical protein